MGFSIASQRRHTAIAIALWTSWPVALGILATRNGAAAASALLLGSAFAATTSVALTWSPARAHQTVAAIVLIVVWLPWAFRMAERFSLSFGPRILAVAESPIAFLLGVIVEALFVAPLPVFAVSIWRRRATP